MERAGRCQSPEMVRREILTRSRAYNLFRNTILESAKRSDLSPRQISFTAAMQIDRKRFRPEKVSGTNGTVKHKSIFTADLRRPKAVVGGGYF